LAYECGTTGSDERGDSDMTTDTPCLADRLELVGDPAAWRPSSAMLRALATALVAVTDRRQHDLEQPQAPAAPRTPRQRPAAVPPPAAPKWTQ
jgi:hypothetical protein